jgi:hypothetical protein
MKRHVQLLTLLCLTLLAAACAPRVLPDTDLLNSPAALETEQIAQIAYHRMEIGLLQTGSYTTNVLVDLALPRGVRWTLEEFSSDSYQLRFSHDELPTLAWLVTPRGVRLDTLQASQ